MFRKDRDMSNRQSETRLKGRIIIMITDVDSYNQGFQDGEKHSWEEAKNRHQIQILKTMQENIDTLIRGAEMKQSQFDNIVISQTSGLHKESNVQIHNSQREAYMKLDGKLSGYDNVMALINCMIKELELTE